jgi:hypothetical protein
MAVSEEPPVGPPKHNPLTAEHYAGIQRVRENLHILADSIQRMQHIFGDHPTLGAMAAQHEMQDKVTQRLLALYPPPRPNPIGE